MHSFYLILLFVFSTESCYGMQNWGKNLYSKTCNYLKSFQKMPKAASGHTALAIYKPQFKQNFSDMYRNYPALKWTAAGTMLGLLYTEQDSLRSFLFTIAPPLTVQNLKKFPRYKDSFIQTALSNITAIDKGILLELLNLYPESAEVLVKTVSENFDAVPADVIRKIMRLYKPAVSLFVVPAMNSFHKIDKEIVNDIIFAAPELAQYFIAPAANNFDQTSPEILGRILFYSPQLAAAAFTEPALRYWQTVDPLILKWIVNYNPQTPIFLKERVKMLQGNVANELFVS